MIEEHPTTMLYEAGLPPSFLSKAVDAYVTIQRSVLPILSIEESLSNPGTDTNQTSQTSGFGVVWLMST